MIIKSKRLDSTNLSREEIKRRNDYFKQLKEKGLSNDKLKEAERFYLNNLNKKNDNNNQR
jgi:hypothetical protein